MTSSSDTASSDETCYEKIANAALNKEFYLKKSRLKQNIDEMDVDAALDDEKSRLLRAKAKVGEKCEKVGFKTWRSHTMFTHPLKGLVEKLRNDYPTIRPNISQAYCKLAEILSAYPELTRKPEVDARVPYETSFRSLHLCEAPGCFVQVLADFLPVDDRSKWKWRMNSLNPYYEDADLEGMIYDDSFVLPHMSNMLYGPDNSGNILNFTEEYIGNVLSEVGKFHLITFDGSIDCTDSPIDQEHSVSPLIRQAFKLLTQMLHKNGCAVFKIFTFFSHDMITFLNLFCTAFNRVILRKPACSKTGNSELYLIGLQYEGAAFRDGEPVLYDQPALKYIVYEAAKYFARHQTDMINFNLSTVTKLSMSERHLAEDSKQTKQRFILPQCKNLSGKMSYK